RRGKRAIAIGPSQLAGRDASNDLLQRMAGSDLRAATSVLEARGPLQDEPAYLGSLRLQHGQPARIDLFERKLRLEARIRRGVEPAGGCERPLTLEPRAVALETQRPRRILALHRGAAGRTQCLRSPALELPARKADPLVCRRNDRFLRHARSLSARCDRSGHYRHLKGLTL